MPILAYMTWWTVFVRPQADIEALAESDSLALLFTLSFLSRATPGRSASIQYTYIIAIEGLVYRERFLTTSPL